jgi:two-component system response regulator AlgR
MPEIDGVEVAARIAGMDRPPAVIFCTAYDEYALDALNQHAIAYLLKPVRESELQRALGSAVRINRAQLAALRGDSGARSEICASGHHDVSSVAIEAVRCFLAEDKYVRVVAPGRELVISETLKDLEAEFGERFLRVHRNALVARTHLQRLCRSGDGWVVQLADVAERPAVSRRHLAAIKSAIAAG